MVPDPLQLAQSQYSWYLKESLAALPVHPQAPAPHLFNIAHCYRILALCALLQEADVDSFRDRLCKSGHTWLYLLNLRAHGQQIPPQIICTSKAFAFSCSLAAGDLSTAHAIAALSPTSHLEHVEYEDDFLFFRFMLSLLHQPDAEEPLQRLLERWKQLLGGAHTARLEVCDALLARERFEERFEGYVGERLQELTQYRRRLDFNPTLMATEGKIDMEGLALLRLAELRGLLVQHSYDLAPSLARLPLEGRLPPPEAWRIP